MGGEAEREAEAWEHSDAFRVEEALEEQRYFERRRAEARESGGPDPDRVALFLRNSVDRVLRYLGMNGPSVIVNQERRNLLRLADELARIPTPTEQRLGWVPLAETDGGAT
ncbi:MAG TPA: hypothetical protein VF746_13190 [Longimicrobium sp.]